jgi:cellobiose transport system substrate-binding protein
MNAVRAGVGRRLGALLLALVLPVAAAGCAEADDGTIRLTVGTFGEFGYEQLYAEYMAEHPGITIRERVTRPEDHHKNLVAHLATDTGAADVEAIEEGWMGQFTAAPNRFVDLNRYGAGDLRTQWPAWKWKAGSAADGRVIGLGTDVGGMAMCYRKDLFAAAGLPTDRAKVAALWPTWEKYISTGLAFRRASPETAFFDGPAAIYRSILGQAPVGIYADDGTIVVADSPGVKRAWELSLQAIQSGLSAKVATFSQDWTAGLNKGTFATLACPSWMMAFIQEQAGSSAGKWDVARVPGDGGNWGGSWLTVPRQSRHPAEAVALAAWLTAPEQQAKVFRSAGNFPSTVSLYDDPAIKDFKNPFFSNAPVGQIFSRSVTSMIPQFMGPKSGDINTRIIDGLTRVEQGKESADASWAKVLKEVDSLG